jgi:hypothetical protein
MFHHELFHNLQRSLNQHFGGDGRVGGAGNGWKFYSEGTAILATSVGLPSAHFGPRNVRRHSTSDADKPLAAATARRDGMADTFSAMYWRFLYEQCGGMKGGTEYPGAGMAVIRRALSALYSGQVVDIAKSRDPFASLPEVANSAFTNTPSCPFRTYEQSLVHFGRALYALRLSGGRCTEPGAPAGCGFYDPHNLYHRPAATELVYDGRFEERRVHSWGGPDVDLFEVALQPSTDGQSLKMLLEPDDGGEAAFIMQVWKLVDGGPHEEPTPVPEQRDGPEVVGAAVPGKRITYHVPTVDLVEFSRLAMIVTRVYIPGSANRHGEYTIRLQPG